MLEQKGKKEKESGIYKKIIVKMEELVGNKTMINRIKTYDSEFYSDDCCSFAYLFGVYSISNFIGYLMPNTFLYK